jgi:hypothetical protein
MSILYFISQSMVREIIRKISGDTVIKSEEICEKYNRNRSVSFQLMGLEIQENYVQ